MNSISYLKTRPDAEVSGVFYVAKATLENNKWTLVICDKTGSMPAIADNSRDYSALIGKDTQLSGTVGEDDSNNICLFIKSEAADDTVEIKVEEIKLDKATKPKVAEDKKPTDTNDKEFTEDMSKLLASLDEKELKKWLMYIYDGLLSERDLTPRDILSLITILR